ncbi:hypothetical protein [Candidatus Parabeggiatoa sp. HSG14]|uniref:hypothetical protein n=1 Tax=Candidatus Parabeggiatoa sp. HSG14 TaxID=3055593 RepID=UPI0025A8D19D|nr:hypothetical protein [Thiotrichales bacterium HSG14]
MSIKRIVIHHPRFGEYEQRIGDTIEEAGHQKLLGPGNTELGWVMPSEHVTEEFVKATNNKVVFEIGSGNGERITRPSLENGAELVYAADIYSEHLETVRKSARVIGKDERVRTLHIKKDWWDKTLVKQPSVAAVLDTKINENIPMESSVDMMIARQVLQFGSPNNFLRFLDLAEAALTVGGEVWGINMSPFIQYIYDCELDLEQKSVKKGGRLEQIVERNRQFAVGARRSPGGYVQKLSDCLAEMESDCSFLYFDIDTLAGILTLWEKSRKERGLDANLSITESDYFSPRSIWCKNKLISRKEYENQENHVFVLKKV